MARALGVIRLSEMTDRTTSPARQREVIEAAARLRGSEIIGWAEDLDVSASKVPPDKRPELAAWLARPDEYDEILFWRLDRFVRSARDLTSMIDWTEDHGKGLASATEPFDLTSPLGEAIAYMAAIFGRMESAANSERVLGAHAYLRQAGRFAGGKPPYWCLAVHCPDGPGWTLIENPVTAPLTREAISRVTAGEAVNAVCADFTRRGIQAPMDGRGKDGPTGAPWRTATMRRMLRSPALLGHAVHQGRSVTGADGMPVLRGFALISQGEFDRLQHAMEENSNGPVNRTQTSSLLLGVALCIRCGGPGDLEAAARLHRGTRGTWNRGPRIPHYLCARAAKPAEYPGRCSAGSILASELEGMAERHFLRLCGAEEQQDRVWDAGEDHGEEIARVRAALANVRAEYDRGGYGYPGGQADYDERSGRLSARLARLGELRPRPAGYRERGTGRTIRAVWEAATVAERRQLMISAGFHLFAERVGPGSAYAGKFEPGTLIVAAERGEHIAAAAKSAVTRDVRPAAKPA